MGKISSNNQSIMKMLSQDHTTLRKLLKDQLKTRSTTTTMSSEKLTSQLRKLSEKLLNVQLSVFVRITLSKELNIQSREELSIRMKLKTTLTMSLNTSDMRTISLNKKSSMKLKRESQ